MINKLSMHKFVDDDT